MTHQFFTPLTPSTTDLVERYADFDENGYIKNYQIINKELIEALMGAGEWLKEGLSEGEMMGEVWSRPNPCEECPERVECSITCRRKHSFDKEVYGGLLCGTLPAAESYTKDKNGAKNKVHFKVHLGIGNKVQNGLVFERHTEYTGEQLEVNKKGEILLRGKALNLRPWSASLYTMFCLHPEGITLSSLYTEHAGEFLKIYKKISNSAIKTKKLKAQLADLDNITRLLNNKLSELNTQLRELGIEPCFLVTATAHKANNKPYFIPYLKEKK
ncbi:MAG: hypothetical protein J6U53_03435 [Tidjanibacter sp.]|nr:hypothetical protein [Tidjanibacter sp.]